MSHFHIHWSTGKVDWERFSTREAAEEAAARLVRHNETYTIKSSDRDTDCPYCVSSENIKPRPS